jgi:hypothetical protein
MAALPIQNAIMEHPMMGDQTGLLTNPPIEMLLFRFITNLPH